MMRFVAATNCSEMHPAETSLYAHLYAHLPSLLTTDQVQASSDSASHGALTPAGKCARHRLRSRVRDQTPLVRNAVRARIDADWFDRSVEPSQLDARTWRAYDPAAAVSSCWRSFGVCLLRDA